VGEVLLVALTGQLDGFSSSEVERHLLGLIEAGEKRLVLDLKGLEYISSVGLGALVLVNRRMKEAGGQVCFCNAREAVRQIFALSGLLQLLQFEVTEQEAVACFGQAKAV